MAYEIIKNKDIDGKETTVIKRTNDDDSISWIPTDPANSDYQEYLKSLDEASTL
jgi:hypothetical protein